MFQFAHIHPLVVSATGALGGLGAWLITHAGTVVLVFQLIGGFFGCVLTIISFVFVMPRFLRFLARAWRQGFLRADKE